MRTVRDIGLGGSHTLSWIVVLNRLLLVQTNMYSPSKYIASVRLFHMH